jgi:hypothetical protein
MRTHPCVRLFCIVDTLTSASVLPGIDDIIDELPESVVRTGHDHRNNMSSGVLPCFDRSSDSHLPCFCWGAADLSKLNSKKLSCRPPGKVAREAGKLIRSPTAKLVFEKTSETATRASCQLTM